VDQVARIVSCLRQYTFSYANEGELQAAIASALEGEGLDFEREVRLSRTDVVDFVVLGAIGVELKIGGSLADVTRQLHRYLGHGRLAALVLATTRARHCSLPDRLHGKRLAVVYLGALG
jgi:hypothetical protein